MVVVPDPKLNTIQALIVSGHPISIPDHEPHSVNTGPSTRHLVHLEYSGGFLTGLLLALLPIYLYLSVVPAVLWKERQNRGRSTDGNYRL